MTCQKTILPFVILPIQHHVLLLTPVYRVILDSTVSWTTYFFSKFATASFVSPKSSNIFLIVINNMHSLSAALVTLFFSLSLQSSPFHPCLFPLLSFWAYDFSPISFYRLRLFPFHHVWETCRPTDFTPPYSAGPFILLLSWHPQSLHPVRNTRYQHYFSPWPFKLPFIISPFHGAL